MTATSATLHQPRKLFPLWIVVLIMLLTSLIVVVHEHAVQRHGSDAESIRQCLDDKGPYQLWRNLDGQTYYKLCQFDDSRWGLQAIVKEGDVWHEKTAFVRGDGSWNDLEQFPLWFTRLLPPDSHVLRPIGGHDCPPRARQPVNQLGIRSRD